MELSARAGRPHYVALSGGRIARRFFAAAANSGKARRGAFHSVQFFWSDERCVPPTEPESNFALAQELMLGPLGIETSQIHRVRGEQPPEVAATEASAELGRSAPRGKEDQAMLDLIFLGMGEDGHVASLFPGEPEEVMNSNAVYRAVVAAKPPAHRISLGYPAIAAARQVWVLASGA